MCVEGNQHVPGFEIAWMSRAARMGVILRRRVRARVMGLAVVLMFGIAWMSLVGRRALT